MNNNLESFATMRERDMDKPLFISDCGRIKSWTALSDGSQWFDRHLEVTDKEFREFIKELNMKTISKKPIKGPKERHPLVIELMKLWILIRAWLFQPKIKAVEGEVCLKQVNKLERGQIVCVKNWGKKKKARYIELLMENNSQTDSFVAVNANGGEIRRKGE